MPADRLPLSEEYPLRSSSTLYLFHLSKSGGSGCIPCKLASGTNPRGCFLSSIFLKLISPIRARYEVVVHIVHNSMLIFLIRVTCKWELSESMSKKLISLKRETKQSNITNLGNMNLPVDAEMLKVFWSCVSITQSITKSVSQSALRRIALQIVMREYAQTWPVAEKWWLQV